MTLVLDTSSLRRFKTPEMRYQVQSWRGGPLLRREVRMGATDA